MFILPEKASKGWDNREGPAILSTVDPHGTPNVIYVSCVKKYGESKLVVADNYFLKTRANILTGSKAAILFMTNDGKAFQFKGSLSYEKEGVAYDEMKKWLDSRYPGHAAVILSIEEVYSGPERLVG